MKIVKPEDTSNYQKLNRNELVDLVDKIMNCVGNDDEISNMIDIFKANIPHPGGSDLIFYPEKEPESAEEVVEIALSYKPIQL